MVHTVGRKQQTEMKYVNDFDDSTKPNVQSISAECYCPDTDNQTQWTHWVGFVWTVG